MASRWLRRLSQIAGSIVGSLRAVAGVVRGIASLLHGGV